MNYYEPNEEPSAYEVTIDGMRYAWDEADNIYRHDPKHPDAREDGFIYLGHLAWPDDPDDPEDAARFMLRDFIQQQNKCLVSLEAIFVSQEAENINDLYLGIYTNTDCGPWLSVELHDGSWRHCGQLKDVLSSDIRRIMVGSIVEGSDAEVCGDPIDLSNHDPKSAVEAFNQSVEWVNDEASILWERDNGRGWEDD